MPRKPIARSINAILSNFGLKVIRANTSDFSLKSAFVRLAERHIQLNTVIDVGASDGRWSEVAHPFYPNAHYLLIEANPYHKDGLEKFRQRYPSVDYVLGVAGSEEGEVYFDGHDPFGGTASFDAKDGYDRLQMVTIDAQVTSKRLAGPFLLKLDTHGFELPILEGAKNTLKDTAVVIMETYNFELHPGVLRFHNMCSFMESHGFRPMDLIEPMRRQRDNVLWQFDLLFARSDRAEFQVNTYT